MRRRPSSRGSVRTSLVGFVATVLAVTQLVAAPIARPQAASPVRAATVTPYYFHGVATDQVNKLNGTPTATFDATAPATGASTILQTTSWLADPNTAEDPTAAFWTGPFSGATATLVRIDWWWHTANPEAIVVGDVIDVSLFADGVKFGNTTEIDLANITATPRHYSTLVDIPVTTIASELIIQASGHFADSSNALFVSYGSPETPSGFSFITVPPNEPSVTFDAADTIAFEPATVVSAHWLGAEPQVTMERRTSVSEAGRLDPNRIFIDWPLSTRAQTGQLNRSLDGGDSFRLLYDPTCAARSRPNCLTGGGGDTEETVNLKTGNLFFADQEALATRPSRRRSTTATPGPPIGRRP